MLIVSGVVLFGVAGAVVAALGRSASEPFDQWRLDEPVLTRVGR